MNDSLMHIYADKTLGFSTCYDKIKILKTLLHASQIF